MVRLDHYAWTITPEMIRSRPFNLRYSRVDKMYRVWQEFSYEELGLKDESPDKTAHVSICTGTHASKREAIEACTGDS